MAQSTPPADSRPSGLAARIAGFYAVLDRPDPALAAALVGPGGAGVLQVRLKPASTGAIRAAVALARPITTAAGALLIVNDRLDVALACGADGVHLGQDDLPLAEARRLVGRRADFLIGVSTHDLDQVAAAVAGGADYLGFGPVFATATKANPDPVVGLDLLARAVAAASPVPVVAIGGIGLARMAEVTATGVAAICAIGAVNRAPDPAAAARQAAGLFR